MNKKNLKGLGALLFILLIALSLVACGSSSSSNNGGEVAVDTDNSNPLFVAVGSEDILVSTDGDTWKPADSKTQFSSNGLRDVAYDGSGRWIAVGGSAGVVMNTSTDGLNWVKVTSPGTNNDLSGVAYGNGLWVATVMWGDTIIYSDNGDTWTVANSIPAASGSYSFSDVAYGNGQYVVVGQDSIGPGLANPTILNSTDGNNWLDAGFIPPISITDSLNNVAYGNGKFIAAGCCNSNVIKSSDGGDTWSMVNTFPLAANIFATAYGNGKWVAVGQDGDIFHSTNDGVDWVKATTPPSSFQPPNLAMIRDVIYGNGLWVAVGFDTAFPGDGYIFHSTDGDNWVAAGTVPLGIRSFWGIAFRP